MNSSAISVGIDDYLDEALGGEDDESEDDANTSHLSLGVSIYDNLLKGTHLKSHLIEYRAKEPPPPIASRSARHQLLSALDRLPVNPSRNSTRRWTCRRHCLMALSQSSLS